MDQISSSHEIMFRERSSDYKERMEREFQQVKDIRVTVTTKFRDTQTSRREQQKRSLMEGYNHKMRYSQHILSKIVRQVEDKLKREFADRQKRLRQQISVKESTPKDRVQYVHSFLTSSNERNLQLPLFLQFLPENQS